ncbi:hypothetical protein KC352_g32383, partial [Hortaea werneckii]
MLLTTTDVKGGIEDASVKTMRAAEVGEETTNDMNLIRKMSTGPATPDDIETMMTAANVETESGSRSPPPRKARGPLPPQDESYRGDSSVQKRDGTATGPPPPKQKPNYKPTGLLAKEANTVAGTSKVLKYHEPPEARKPPPQEPWRLYVFKQKDLTDTIHLHTRSVWLVGRDQSIADLHV